MPRYSSPSAQAARPRIFVAIRPTELVRLYDRPTLQRLDQIGEVVFADDEGRVELPPRLAEEFDVLITSWSTARFDPAFLRGSRLRLAVHTAGSIRGLFPADALTHELRLAQGGSAPMATAVAELALTLTLVLLRNVHWMDRRLQAGEDWSDSGSGTLGQAIHEQTIGVLGLSRTGREYVRMVTGLGAKDVLVHDPFASETDAAELGLELVGLDELCRRSQVLAVHAPVTESTRGMLDRTAISRLHDGAIVINTARSAVIDMDALTAELVAGRLRAGLDVFDVEPLPTSSPLLGLDNVVITPHVAGGTVEARFGQGAGVVQEIEAFLAGKPLHYEVTPEIYHRLS